MLVARLESKFRMSKQNEAVAWHQANYEPGGAWHNKTDGYRIYFSTASKGATLAVEMGFADLAAWGVAREEAGKAMTAEHWEMGMEIFTEEFEWTYWTLAGEG